MQSRWDFKTFLGHTLCNAVPHKKGLRKLLYLLNNFVRVGYHSHISYFSGMLYGLVQKQGAGARKGPCVRDDSTFCP